MERQVLVVENTSPSEIKSSHHIRFNSKAYKIHHILQEIIAFLNLYRENIFTEIDFGKFKNQNLLTLMCGFNKNISVWKIRMFSDSEKIIPKILWSTYEVYQNRQEYLELDYKHKSLYDFYVSTHKIFRSTCDLVEVLANFSQGMINSDKILKSTYDGVDNVINPLLILQHLNTTHSGLGPPLGGASCISIWLQRATLQLKEVEKIESLLEK